MEYLETILNLVAGLVGFPAALAATINVLKYFYILPDGAAPAASEIGHLLAYVGVGVLVLTGRVDLLPGIDLQLGALANVLLAVLAFLSSLNVARAFHDNVLLGLPVVGFSHSVQYSFSDLMAMAERLRESAEEEETPGDGV